VFVALLLGGPLGGWASDQAAKPGAAAEIDTLRQRVAAYWAARVAQDSATLWRLIEPRAQGRMTAEEYAAQGASVKFMGYRVEDATISGNFATVKVRLVGVADLPLMRGGAQTGPQASVIDDQWVRVRGAWYRVIDKLEQ
jgi:hypothetical protein